MKKTLLLAFLGILFCTILISPTYSQLSPGAISIVGFNSDNPDRVTFVAVDDIPGGTEIFFTDNGVKSDGSFRDNEGTLSYIAPAEGLFAGQVVEINPANGTTPAVSTGSITKISGSFALAGGGDQIVAFTGSKASPNFIAAVQIGSNTWDANSTTSNTSALPTGLTNGLNATTLNAQNGEYTGSRTFTGSRSEFLSQLNDNSNWSQSSNSIELNSSDFTVLLPVEFISFDGIARNKTVKLQWKTASEINNDRFEIERSVDGQRFITIGKIEGNGNSNVILTYNFTDRTPANLVNYYRLKQVDYDGKYDYSKVVRLNNKVTESKIYPTVTTGQLTIERTEDAATTYNVLNQYGQLVMTKNSDASSFTMDISNLSSGVYFIMDTNNTAVSSTRIIKQ